MVTLFISFDHMIYKIFITINVRHFEIVLDTFSDVERSERSVGPGCSEISVLIMKFDRVLEVLKFISKVHHFR